MAGAGEQSTYCQSDVLSCFAVLLCEETMFDSLTTYSTNLKTGLENTAEMAYSGHWAFTSSGSTLLSAMSRFVHNRSGHFFLLPNLPPFLPYTIYASMRALHTSRYACLHLGGASLPSNEHFSLSRNGECGLKSLASPQTPLFS